LQNDLDPLNPTEPEAILKAAKKTYDESMKLVTALPPGLPIFMVRNAAAWSRLSSVSRGKTLIIEHADNMLDASRNALLKLLEEPPESLTIILTTERKGAMLETILSRLRPFHFTARDARTSAEIISRIFGDKAEAGADLASYLSSFTALSDADGEASATAFLNARLCARRELSPGLPDPDKVFAKGTGSAVDLKDILADRESFQKFLLSLSRGLSRLLRAEPGNPELLALSGSWNAFIADAATQAGTYNLSPDNVMRNLSFRMERET
jgi:DNA polymerase-3 subunit gamma/tau